MYKETFTFDILRFAFSGTSSRDKYKNILASNVVYGNGGNDSLVNSADDVTLSGGAGNDTIINTFSVEKGGDNVSINGGAGNDTIYGDTRKPVVYVYKKGDGNDVISNFSASQKDKTPNCQRQDKQDAYQWERLNLHHRQQHADTQKRQISKNFCRVCGRYPRLSSWFTEDDTNFITDDDNFVTADSFTPMDAFSELSVQTYSVGEIQTFDYTALVQKAENRLTYGYKK